MTTSRNGKVALIGGGGIRTPLLVYGINETAEQTGIRELVLFDNDPDRAALMASLGRAIVRRENGSLRIIVADSLAAAVDGADFVISSIRPGGIAGRAQDERLAFEHGFAGQETTGPGGFFMAMRTIPVTLEHARVVERYAPGAWYVSFTNPAGLISQALALHTKLRVMGICDTPIELFHFIAQALGVPAQDVSCEYAGLNHLGWVRKVLVRGRDVTADLLANDEALGKLYPADLFAPDLIRALGVIPTEYLYFYYRRGQAYRNQAKVKTTRGGEIERLNQRVFAELAGALSRGDEGMAIDVYVRYLNQRSGSYMKLEANAGSAFDPCTPQNDPFRSSTGYHRMVLEVIAALRETTPRGVVANVRNQSALDDFDDEDVVEAVCDISSAGAKPRRYGRLPQRVRGLAVAMKEFERETVRAAVDGSFQRARAALLVHPLIGDWDAAEKLLQDLARNHPGMFRA
jgi:6-phospho-beta-glucosidase